MSEVSVNPTPAKSRSGRPEAARAIWDPRGDGTGGRRPDLRAVRRRGVVRGLIGAAVGAVLFLLGREVLAAVAWALSGTVLILALASPGGLYAALERGLGLLAHWVGRLLSVVLLAPLFAVFFTLFGRLLRGGRRDRLERWLDPGTPTYWKGRPDAEPSLDGYRKGF